MTLPNIIPHPAGKDRSKYVGSTDARIIASGEGWLDLYLQKTGATERDDLTYAWKPRLGIETEKLHAFWHGHQTGDKVIDAYPDNLPVTHKDAAPHHATSIDRLVRADDGMTVLEMKHTNERNNLRDAATYYMAQIQWQMFILHLSEIRFSIIRGNNEPEWGVVARDQEYIDTLVGQVEAFWWHVENGEAPEKDSPKPRETAAALKAAAGSVPLNGFKPYDMSTNNEWSDAAWDFIRDKAASASLKETEKRIRGLIPKDAETVTGAGLSFKRDARGAYRVSIDEEELGYWQTRFAKLKGLGSEQSTEGAG